MRALTTVALLAAMAPAVRAASPARDTFVVQAELQSLYDEESAASSLTRDGAVTLVTLTTVHDVIDEEGRYGRQGARHTLTESTRYKDTWIQVGDGWKQQSREQLGRPSQRVDEPAG